MFGQTDYGYTREQLEAEVVPTTTEEEATAYWAEQVESYGIAEALELLEKTAERALITIKSVLKMGKDYFTSVRASRMLGMVNLLMVGDDVLIRQSTSTDQKAKYVRIQRKIQMFLDKIGEIAEWETAPVDFVHLKEYLMEDAIAAGDLDNPVINPDMKRHYVALAYNHPDFSETEAADVIRANYSPDASKKGGTPPLAIAAALGLLAFLSLK